MARAASHQKVAGPFHGNWRADSALLMANGALEASDRTHIARHDPARVLREVEAKRAILALLHLGPDTWDYESNANPENAMHEIEREHDYELACHLAAVYADHPSYDEAWKP